MILEEKKGKSIIENIKETRLMMLAEERKEKYRDLDKKILNSDKSLKTQESLISNQPVLGIKLSQNNDINDFRLILRNIEIINEREAPENKEVINALSNAMVEVYNKIRMENRILTNGGLYVFNNTQEINEIKDEFCDVMEITRGFCYLKHLDDVFDDELLFVWKNFKSDALQKCGKWDTPEKIFENLKNITKMYGLTKTESINLFANNIYFPEFGKTFEILSNQQNWGRLKNDLDLDENGRNEFDSALLQAFISNRELFNFRQFNRSLSIENEGELIKKDYHDSIRNLISNGLENTAVFLAGRIAATRYSLETEVGSRILTEMLRSNQATELKNRIISEFQEIKIDEKKIPSLLEKQKNIEKDIFFGDSENYEIWLNFMEEIERCEGDFEGINIENIFKDDKIVDNSFYKNLVINKDNTILAAAACAFPTGMPVIYNLAQDKDDFIEVYLENGGSLEEVEKLEKIKV